MGYFAVGRNQPALCQGNRANTNDIPVFFYFSSTCPSVVRRPADFVVRFFPPTFLLLLLMYSICFLFKTAREKNDTE